MTELQKLYSPVFTHTNNETKNDLVCRKGRQQHSHSKEDHGADEDTSSETQQLPAVLYRASFRNAVWDVMRQKTGWKETTSNADWDFNWADVGWIREHFDNIHMEEHQKVNHFRNHYEITRKDLLVKNIKRMKKQLERSEAKEEATKYDFLPESYVLPGEYGMLYLSCREGIVIQT